MLPFSVHRAKIVSHDHKIFLFDLNIFEIKAVSFFPRLVLASINMKQPEKEKKKVIKKRKSLDSDMSPLICRRTRSFPSPYFMDCYVRGITG